MSALIEVLTERERQRELWGDGHDDSHTSHDWTAFIDCRLKEYHHHGTSEDRRRELMVHIAALAIAALEADDRNGLAMQT